MCSSGTIKIERQAWPEQDRMIVVIAYSEGEKVAVVREASLKAPSSRVIRKAEETAL